MAAVFPHADAAVARVAAPAKARRFAPGFLRTAFIHAVLIGTCILIVLPLLWMFLSAHKSHEELFTKPFWWIPAEPHLFENISRVFERIDFGRYFFNSLFVSSVVTTLDLFFSTMAGYALAKFRFPGRDLIFGAIIATMMIPAIVIVIPQYILIRDFGWLDSYYALIIPFAVSSFGIFLIRQALIGFPD
jgi:multiple sugar transport system permease protein